MKCTRPRMRKSHFPLTEEIRLKIFGFRVYYGISVKFVPEIPWDLTGKLLDRVRYARSPPQVVSTIVCSIVSSMFPHGTSVRGWPREQTWRLAALLIGWYHLYSRKRALCCSKRTLQFHKRALCVGLGYPMSYYCEWWVKLHLSILPQSPIYSAKKPDIPECEQSALHLLSTKHL